MPGLKPGAGSAVAWSATLPELSDGGSSSVSRIVKLDSRAADPLGVYLSARIHISYARSNSMPDELLQGFVRR